MVADDQLINIEVIKTHLTELGHINTCNFCINGQETIDKVKELVDTAVREKDAKTKIITPVNFLLLDF